MSSVDGWLDTNVILRFLLNDHPDHSPRARALIERAERGEASLRAASHIVCEVVYVLESQGYSREQIFDALRDFSQISGVEFEEGGSVLEALVDFKERNVDFSDALLAAWCRNSGGKVWTFNKKHFARLAAAWREPD